MQMLNFTYTDAAGREYPAAVFMPARPTRDIVFLHSAANEAADVWAMLPKPRPVLVFVGGIDWNADLSPWKAPAAFRSSPDFSGGADAYLDTLTNGIVPAAVSAVREAFVADTPASAESAFPTAHADNAALTDPADGTSPTDFTDFRLILAGYSLAGLFAAYAPYRTAVFSRIASMSGSMWFDGFADFAASSPMVYVPERAYFSLGDREAKVRDPRMAAVAECTADVVGAYRSRGARTQFVSEPGGHFTDVPARIARGIAAVTA